MSINKILSTSFGLLLFLVSLVMSIPSPTSAMTSEEVTYEWVRTWGGTGADIIYDLTATSDTIFVGGRFNDTTDFDPGEGVDERVSAGGKDALSSAG